MTSTPQKTTLRRQCLSLRNALSSIEKQMASTLVCQQIMALSQYKNAKSIALYQAINGEIDLNDIWLDACYQNKRCYFPIINDDLTLSFLPATPKTPFNDNRFGIPEPQVMQKSFLSPSDFDIVFLPLVAFDQRGTRLGMGGGYYDRTFSQKKPLLLAGVAYDFQKQPMIEKDSWDISMDVTITANAIYWSNR